MSKGRRPQAAGGAGSAGYTHTSTFTPRLLSALFSPSVPVLVVCRWSSMAMFKRCRVLESGARGGGGQSCSCSVQCPRQCLLLACLRVATSFMLHASCFMLHASCFMQLRRCPPRACWLSQLPHVVTVHAPTAASRSHSSRPHSSRPHSSRSHSSLTAHSSVSATSLQWRM